MESGKKSVVTLSPKKAGLSKAARDLLARVRASPSPGPVFGGFQWRERGFQRVPYTGG